jgi:hypothetical protein
MQKPPDGKIVAQEHYASRLAPLHGRVRLSKRNFTPDSGYGGKNVQGSPPYRKIDFHIEKTHDPLEDPLEFPPS